MATLRYFGMPYYAGSLHRQDPRGKELLLGRANIATLNT